MATPEEFVADLNKIQAGLGEFVRDFLVEDVSVQIGGRAVAGMRDVGPGAGLRAPNDSGPLRIIEGRLARSLRPGAAGASRALGQGSADMIREIEVSGDSQLILRFGSRVPYARIHELGGFIRVTPRMRRFFWAKYYDAGETGREARFWKNMATMNKSVITIPARPYLRPATLDAMPTLRRRAQEQFTNFIRIGIS